MSFTGVGAVPPTSTWDPRGRGGQAFPAPRTNRDRVDEDSHVQATAEERPTRLPAPAPPPPPPSLTRSRRDPGPDTGPVPTAATFKKGTGAPSPRRVLRGSGPSAGTDPPRRPSSSARDPESGVRADRAASGVTALLGLLRGVRRDESRRRVPGPYAATASTRATGVATGPGVSPGARVKSGTGAWDPGRGRETHACGEAGPGSRRNPGERRTGRHGLM